MNGMQIVKSQCLMSEGVNGGSHQGHHIRCTLISTDRSRVQPSPEVFVFVSDGERKRRNLF